ncbi:phosphotransferase [Dyadobacter pollutisoli]|jgi:hypothetical protein|uniref:Phosphotransferase n=1 Tax=Dyadobacter pollutisoli TaxID=2910158 RepID=A0A9E8NAC8_9BACT|nr:phosphotransferase [Dyadobacter pollutisoli]WAC11422.1 phosphotransferase [Dyadobacter pollutisoli]
MANNSEKAPPQYLRDLLEAAVGQKSMRWTVPDCGLSSAHRFVVQLETNHSVFVKAATDEETEQWLRTEHSVLSAGAGNFMPDIIDWLDPPGMRPVLITEDLSKAYWPASHAGVTWRKGDFDLFFDGLKELSAFKTDLTLPKLKNPTTPLWSEIADDPTLFLQLQLCSEQWLSKSIGTLIQAENNVNLTGDRLVHGDVRSDNICFAGSQLILVDWSHAARGNALHDLAHLLPTLHLEGGPEPYHIMPDGGSIASLQSAGHIWRIIEDHSMPQWLQQVFKKLIAIELEWAASCLGLETPDGLVWRREESHSRP